MVTLHLHKKGFLNKSSETEVEMGLACLVYW